MSRSNHNYYNLGLRYRKSDVIPERTFATRRGLYTRRKRFPRWSIKSFRSGPPKEIKQMWHRQARAAQNSQMRDDDPVVTPMRRLINMWNWY